MILFINVECRSANSNPIRQAIYLVCTAECCQCASGCVEIEQKKWPKFTNTLQLLFFMKNCFEKKI